MGSKDAPQKMQFLGEKWQVWFHGAEMQNGGKPPQNRLSPIQKFLDIPTVHEQGQICIRGFMGKISSGENFLVSKITHR